MEIHENEQKLVEELQQFGLKKDSDFYIEPIFELTAYIEYVSRIIVCENDYENDNYDIHKNAEYQDVLHKEKRVIGFQILDNNFKSIKIEELTKNVKKTEIKKHGINQCSICGKKVIISKFGIDIDKRAIDKEVRCFDHIGVKKEID